MHGAVGTPQGLESPSDQLSSLPHQMGRECPWSAKTGHLEVQEQANLGPVGREQDAEDREDQRELNLLG